MWTREELKNNAKEALKRNYWKAVLVSLLLLMLGEGINPVTFMSSSNNNSSDNVHTYAVEAKDFQELNEVMDFQELEELDKVVLSATVVAFVVIFVIIIIVLLAFEIFIGNLLVVGSQRFMLKCVAGKGDIAELGYSFDHSYLNCVKTMAFRDLHVFLWALLFIIPGVYKKYQYYMVEYILAENPDMPYKEVLELSKNMMEGQKWNAFVLDLSFILWHMLSMITCGILEIMYVRPYKIMTRASLYRTLCELREGNGYKNEL